MALQLGALIDAGASPEKAGKASEELATVDREFSDVRSEMRAGFADVRSDLKLLKGMNTVSIAMSTAILPRLFIH